MTNEYFDTWEFTRALDLINTNPVESKQLFEEYLKKHPVDYSAYTFYASCLINLGELAEAEKVLDDIEEKVDANALFQGLKDRYGHFIDTIVFTRIRLYSYKREYKKMHDFCTQNLAKLKELKIREVLFYVNAKLGTTEQFFSVKREDHAYLYRQMLEYQEEDFKEHIKKHLADTNADLITPNQAVFTPNFPIDKILEEIKKYIPSDKCIGTGFFEHKYVFKFDECGRVDNKLTDYFKVVAFEGTQNFITIYPTVNYKYFPSVDLNYLKDQEEQPEVKTKSRIDRFNERLNKGKK